MICTCPAAPALPDIPEVICSESLGQIQKVAFQRLYKDDGTRNSFNGEGDSPMPITALASWTPLLSANDSLLKLLFLRTLKHRQQKRAQHVPLVAEMKHLEVLKRI